MNPRDLSTVSSALGELGSTVAIQGSNIYDLYGQVSSLSTAQSSLSNFVIDFTNSTIQGLSTFSTFYDALGALSNVTKIGLSTISTTIFATNSTQNTFLASTILQAANSTMLSTSTGLARRISTYYTSTTTLHTFYSTTAALNRAILSTSGGLAGNISSVYRVLSTAIYSTNLFTNSTFNTIFQSTSALEARTSTLLSFYNFYSTSTEFIARSTFNAQNVSTISSINAVGNTTRSTFYQLIGILSTVSTNNATYTSGFISSIDNLTTTNLVQDAQISTLARNLSILTTSSILAGVYDTFTQLEAYTSSLIGSTIATNLYWQSSLYYSTIIQNQAISQVYFSTFTGTAFLSTVSATTALANAYTSTYTTQLYSTGLTFIYSSLTSTLFGVSFSPAQLRSTNVFIGSNAGAVNQANFTVAVGNQAGSNAQGLNAVAIGNSAGLTSQGQNAVAIGNGAGVTSQGPGTVAIGLNAGANNQLFNCIAIGCNAGFSGQTNNGIAIGALAGSNNQANVTVAVGHQAGQDSQGGGGVAVGWATGRLSQGQNGVAVGDRAGESNQANEAISVGSEAGRVSQGTGAIAIGKYASFTGQGAEAVAIGHFGGYANQGLGAVGIGFGAGYQNQGNYAIAVGYDAGNINQHANSIILNATGSVVNSATTNAFYVKPVRSNAAIGDAFLHYDVTTNEIVYNNVGGSGGTGLVSSFNDLIYSTSRGLATTSVNVNSIETAKVVEAYRPFINRNRTLISTISGAQGRWTAGLSISADGKYQAIGAGNGALTGDAAYLYQSSDYGQSWYGNVALGLLNWNGTCMSRDGRYQYLACGGTGGPGAPVSGGVYKSDNFGRNFSLQPSPSGWNIWGAGIACSGDGRIVFALQTSEAGDITPRASWISYNFGNSFVQAYGANRYFYGPSVSITGQYMAVGVLYYNYHSHSDVMLVSNDYGKTWTNPIGIVAGVVGGIIWTAMSADGKYQYGVGMLVTGYPAFYYSEDYGKSFSLGSYSGVASSPVIATFQISCDDTGQFVTATVYDLNPSNGGILFSDNYGRTYRTLLNIDLATASCISANAQYISYAPRFRLYTSIIPSYFPAGIYSFGNDTSSIMTVVNSNAGTVPAGGTSDVYNSIISLGAVNGMDKRTWEIGMATNGGSGNNLGFLSYDTANFTGTRTLRGIIVTGNSNAIMNFTGQHRCFPADNSLFPLTSNIGKIVIATGQYQAMPQNGGLVRGISSITISESLPLVRLSYAAQDKRCFGVICDVEDYTNRYTVNGNFTTVYPKIRGDTRIFVNSLGEGAIWVCDAGGSLENGDYLTTSAVPGYAMKQSEAYIANFTVAKATMTCDFAPRQVLKQIPQTAVIHGQKQYVLDAYSTIVWTRDESFEPEYALRYISETGQEMSEAEYRARIATGRPAYKAAFIGCTYHCG